MKQLELVGKGGKLLAVHAALITRVEALNHDDTVRRILCLYKTEHDYICQRIDYPDTIDVRYRLDRCSDVFSVYQSLGTEPLANYLYGCAGLNVPGLRKVN